MSTITKTTRRAVIPGRLTADAERKLQDAVSVLIDANLNADEGTALAAESHNLSMGLLAFIEAYRGGNQCGGS